MLCYFSGLKTGDTKDEKKISTENEDASKGGDVSDKVNCAGSN